MISYRSQFTNNRMFQELSRRENISALEEIIDRDTQQIRVLEKDYDKILDMKQLDVDEMKKEFAYIGEEVKKFLGFIPPKEPRVRYHSAFTPSSIFIYAGGAALTVLGLYRLPDTGGLMNIVSGACFISGNLLFDISPTSRYHSITKECIILKDSKAGLALSIAHEYSHHLAASAGFWFPHMIFNEGLARCTERHIGEHYLTKKNNSNPAFRNVEKALEDYKASYVWICNKLVHEPDKKLISDKDRSRYARNKPDKYSVGNSVLSIQALRQGTGIYRQLLNEEFKFA